MNSCINLCKQIYALRHQASTFFFFFLVETSSIQQPRVERILQELHLSDEGTTTSVLHLSNLEGENDFMMMFKS